MAYDATDFEIDPLTLTTPRARLEYLALFLRGLPTARFDMGNFSAAQDDEDYVRADQLREDCGTKACIAGWAVALFTKRELANGSWRAAQLLGLTDNQSSRLFYANALSDEPLTYWKATPDQAAAVITHLLNTGEVDWSVAGEVEA